MVVGVCRVDLFISGSASLKDKRQVMQKVLDRTRQKFHVSVAEVGDNDLWQRARIGLAVVGNDRGHVRGVIDTVVAFIEGLYVADIVGREVEVVSYGDSLEE